MNDIAMLKPTMFIGVPRVFDRIYSTVTAKTKAAVSLRSKAYGLKPTYGLAYGPFKPMVCTPCLHSGL